MAFNKAVKKSHPKRVQVRMNQELYEWIGRGTYQLELSGSDIMRRAVKMYLKKHGVK